MKKRTIYVIGAILLLAVVIIATVIANQPKHSQPYFDPNSACDSVVQPEDTSMPQPTGSVTEVSDETIELHEELLEVTAEDGETQTNPYCKSGTNAGEMVYWVCKASDSQMMALPMNETVIYEVDGEDHYMERVSFSYTQDNETVNVTQYRLFVPASSS